ncbi:uncharacterized protein BCR38DRAFT_446825 [Pseudomassariella vexata]|uniref:CBM1 domain-containing protein n=1 Tax=Pseudomassariella vexata TaxID=1141098 RepID=A0A1Y2DI09_9PEZI|nr:uncharacterized protein BCR38DRAFT_446825 [Pseudomassariella vexata]ORY58872.1 hypothetical protein BCR38DRAFT_446825 [Pseudomassariella vexata]
MLYQNIFKSLVFFGALQAAHALPAAVDDGPSPYTPTRQAEASSVSSTTASATPACVSTPPDWCAAHKDATLWCITGKWWCEYPDPVYGSPSFGPIENACSC